MKLLRFFLQHFFAERHSSHVNKPTTPPPSFQTPSCRLAIGMALLGQLSLATAGHPVGHCYGYGSEDNWGGHFGPTVYATNEAELRALCDLPVAENIILTSSLNLTNPIIVKSNKTIQGMAFGAITINGNFKVIGENVIIRHLTFTNPADGDGITVWNPAKRVLIYSCSFYNCKDDLVDVTAGANYVTIAYCKFYHTNLSVLHRYGTEIWAKYQDCYVTMHHNWYSTGMQYRMPLVTGYNESDQGRDPGSPCCNAYVHLFCNYYSTGTKQAEIVIAKRGFVKGESNVFYKERNPWIYSGSSNGSETGNYPGSNWGLWLENTAYINPRSWSDAMKGMVARHPSYGYGAQDTNARFDISYQYNIDGAGNVRNYVISNAGNNPNSRY